LIAEALPAPQGKSEQAGTRRRRPSAKLAGKASDTAAETLAAKLDPIRSAYVNAFRRGASPRERASIVENFDFLIALLDGFDTAGDGRHAEAHGLRPLVSALIVLREHVQERS
jgi:flagellar biosynthesis/type III secretory pathway ATPase